MGKEQKDSLRGSQENPPRGAQLGEQAIAPAVPRLEPVEIFPGQAGIRRTKAMQRVEAVHGVAGESIVDILNRLYHTKGKTQAEVASILGMSQKRVFRWMKATGVESRPGGPRRGEKRNVIGHKERQVTEIVGNLRDFLHTQREEKGASMAAIAKEIERKSDGRVTVSLGTVERWLRKLGIKSMRAKPESRSGWHHPEATKEKMSKAQKEHWQRDRERLVARIQSEEAKSKRRAGLKRFYASEKGQGVIKAAAAKRVETKKRKAREKGLAKLQATLGGNPTEILRRMHWNEGLTVEAIGERIGEGATETITLMQYAGVGIREEDKQRKRKKVGRVKEEDRKTYEQAFEAGLISKLPEKWRYILADHLTKKPTTLAEVGKKHGLTSERVRQIEKRALIGLRRMLAGEELPYRFKESNQRRALGENPKEALRMLCDAGLSNREIAQKIGVSFSTVRRWRKEFGLKKTATRGENAPAPPAERARRQPLPAYEIVKPLQPEWFKEIDVLGLSTRTRNTLVRNNLDNLRAIDGKTDEELLTIESFGPKALREVRDKLEEFRRKASTEKFVS